MSTDFIAQCLYGFLIYYQVNPWFETSSRHSIHVHLLLYRESTLCLTQCISVLTFLNRISFIELSISKSCYLPRIFCSSWSCRSRLSLTCLSRNTSICSSAANKRVFLENPKNNVLFLAQDFIKKIDLKN